MGSLTTMADTSDPLQTARTCLPSPSVEPQIVATFDVKHDPQKPAVKLGKKTFESQRTSDRHGVGSHIARSIARSNKTNMMVLKDKWDLLLQWHEEGTVQREKDGKGSVRLNFEDDYDQKDDHKWLKKRFKEYLSEPLARLGVMAHVETRPGADQDDEEAPPDEEAGYKDKRKPSLHQDGESRARKMPGRAPRHNYTESDDESTSYAESDAEDDDRHPGAKKKAKIVECEACSRGFSTIAGRTNAQDANDEARADAPTCMPRLDKQAPRRRWIWNKGEMLVWPPFSVDATSTAGSEAGEAGDVS